MEDIILIKIADDKKKKYYFLTWGRLFDSTDDELYLNLIKNNAMKFGIKSVFSIEICESLQEGSKSKYFYENFFLMCQKKIPFGKKYKSWQKVMRKRVEEGKELYFL